MKGRRYEFALAGTWLVADQLTKLWAGNITIPIEIVPGWFRFALSHNRGALFGMLGTIADPWRTLILTGLPLLAIVGIVGLILRTPPAEAYARTGLSLILGGAVGNVLDRVVYGHVVDFIDVYSTWPPLMDRLIDWFGTNRWPTFNVADMGLVCGAALLLYEIFFRRSGAPKGAADSAPPGGVEPAAD